MLHHKRRKQLSCIQQLCRRLADLPNEEAEVVHARFLVQAVALSMNDQRQLLSNSWGAAKGGELCLWLVRGCRRSKESDYVMMRSMGFDGKAHDGSMATEHQIYETNAST